MYFDKSDMLSTDNTRYSKGLKSSMFTDNILLNQYGETRLTSVAAGVDAHA